MRSTSRAAIASIAAVIAGLLGLYAYRAHARVTFTRDVAPIVFARCAPCHRPGQSGPFSLLSYADVRAHGRDIADVVGDRYMPPWKPSDRNGRFAGDRSLRDADIALIRGWVNDGMPEGAAADLPALPKWPKTWQLGEPDAVVRMDAPYALAAQGQDEYRNFVIASPVREPRYVVGWEFHAGGRAIHHAILKIDRMGNARRADAADPGPGFGDMEFDGAQAPDGFYLVWAPGKAPARATDGSAWRIDGNTDLVLQLHMQRTGKIENVAPEIALYFADAPPTQRRYSVRIGDLPIDIAPGDADYHMTDSYTLPAPVRILSMFPHAHYVANKVRVWSSMPDGSELELLRIDDWDFNWQDEYTFVDPPLLPAGSSLHMHFSYDNSDKNPRNPSHPPRRVRDGKQSTDEMGNVTFQALPARAQDLDALLESKYRRQLGRARNADGLYNLANALSRQGKTAEAIEQYRAAIALDPKLKPAHYNLAGALLASGAREQAVPELEAALAITPDDLDARLMLGSTFAQLGRTADAWTQYERALTLDPKNAAGHVMLADLLRTTGKRDEARAHYEEALRLKPDWQPARDGLAALAN